VLLLGIDVGGTKTALALGGADGTLRARRRLPTPPGDAGAALERLAAEARALLDEAGVEPVQLAAVGVSAPGPLDAGTGLVLGPPNLPGWERVPVVARLEAALGRPVFLENDANAAALAEWRFGAARGLRDVAFLTTSTGVGAGLILGGRLHRGHRGAAGEVGHSAVEWSGEPCACGLRGCLEAYVGGAAWTRRLRGLVPPGSAVAALAGGADAVRPEHVVRAAQEGDAFARDELARYVEYLARGIRNLVFTVAPELVLLGTIPSAAGEELCFEPLRRRVAEQIWPGLARALRIEAAGLGETLADYAGLAVARAGLEAASAA
jgi:glucokinase